jgi:folate-binding protein YgfZ
MTLELSPGDQSTLAKDYGIVREGGAGLIDFSTRGRLLVSGSEAVMFLNGLITNDMKTLAVNSWMPAVFPNVQGRLLAAVRIIHRQDGFLIDTENATTATVIQLLERFTMAGDFRVRDLTDEFAELSVQGRGSATVIQKVFGEGLPMPARAEARSSPFENSQHEVTVIRATHTGEDGFDLFVSRDDSQRLIELLGKAGAKPLGDATIETLRIEAGIPRFGIDMDESRIVSETNLDDAVSFTKGCYIGQEIIARIKYRGHVARKLAGLKLDSQAEIVPGAKVFSTDVKEIGAVTSVTVSPLMGTTVALAYLKFDYLPAGTSVKVESNESPLSALVAELPFIRGSWYSS